MTPAMELMRALDATGNRAGALRHARIHATLLAESLGVEPTPALRDLVDELSRPRDMPGQVVTVPANGATPPLATDAPSSSSPITPPDSSIAVLPFSNVSESDADAYFADGISEELMYLLTRTPGLRVASRMSAFACRDLNLDAREVAARLQVKWILEGSVRRSGDVLRIVARLTDARSGYQVWAERFDRASSDVLAIQAEIAEAIAHRLAPALGGRGATAMRAGSAGAPDPDTYDLYLRARHQWHQRTEESLFASVALFEQVVARDPTYASAWTGLADAYVVIAFYDYIAPDVAYPRADAAARRAIQLDPGCGAPHATLAHVDTYYRWDWANAERGFLHAIELDPTYSTAHQWYANLLTSRGRFDEAERELRRAAELDPLSMIAHTSMGWMLMFADQGERAIQHLRRALELDSRFCLAHYWMGLAHLRNGQAREAIPFLEYVLSPGGGAQTCSMTWATLARARAAAGDVAESRGILANLLQREGAGHYVSSFQLAKLYQALDDIPAALTRLERAYTEHAHSLAFLRVDPQFRPLMREPRFLRLIELVEGRAAAS
jgi:TolB-like protein/Tfp pilus assembly protein PilF